MKKILVFLFLSRTCFPVIDGTLSIDTDCSDGVIWYNSSGQKKIEESLNILMAPYEPVISIQAHTFDNKTIYLHHPYFSAFPNWLPFQELEDKKEGDLVEIRTQNNKEICLICDATFNHLPRLIRAFQTKPTVHLFDESHLETHGVIRRNENDEWEHGPNGYEFEIPTDDPTDSE